MHDVRIADRVIGEGRPCLIAAEIGINHNGDMDLARREIAAAAAAGVDAVKFQNYRTEDFIGDPSLTYAYGSAGKRVEETQYDLFKRCELRRDQLAGLKSCCDAAGVLFFSTPTGRQGVSDLVELGVPMLKNGSDFLVHLPLIAEMAGTGLPVILSAGMATLSEIDEAVRVFRRAGGKDLILLHCTSSYPTPDRDVNLRRIPSLARVFDCPAGFSDHTKGVVAAVGAVALGACFIEKHFTLDKGLPGPDHRFSADPGEMKELVSAVRTLERQVGATAIGPTGSEREGRKNFRLSCVAAADLPAGHVLKNGDIVFRRPGTGVPPKAREWLSGRRLSRAVRKGHPFVPGDVL